MDKKEKDWKERFRDLDFLVKIKDSFGWTNEIDYEVLENFFEQEIDRAREEVLKELIKEYEVFDKKYNMNKTEELKHMITKLTK